MSLKHFLASEKPLSGNEEDSVRHFFARVRHFSFDARAIFASVQLRPIDELDQYGGHLAGVLDRLRDQEPERFEVLNEELGRWFREFDRILFNTPGQGRRAFFASNSQGTTQNPCDSSFSGNVASIDYSHFG